MESKSVGVEELLVTVSALEREVAFVAFKMIVHSVLMFFRNTTDAANEVTCCIFLVFVDHGVWVGGRGGVQFFTYHRREQCEECPPPQ